MEKSKAFAGIAAFLTAVIIAGIWAYHSDQACKAKYGDAAALHGGRYFNECVFEDQIKPL